jgi:hypothetical protein
VIVWVARPQMAWTWAAQLPWSFVCAGSGPPAVCPTQTLACAQLEASLACLSDAQKLAARVSDLEAANAALTSDSARLQASLSGAESALAAARTAAEAVWLRCAAAEAAAERAGARAGACTPRPRRDMGLLADLLSEQELGLVEKALIGGGRRGRLAGWPAALAGWRAGDAMRAG